MSEIGDGFSRFDNIRRNAYWALNCIKPKSGSTIFKKLICLMLRR